MTYDNSSNPYMIRKPSQHGGRDDVYLDVIRFAGDLAAKLGGTISKQDDSPSRPYYANIALAGDIELHISAQQYGASLGRASIGIQPTDISRDVWSLFTYDREGKYKLPSITVDPSRPLEHLTRDIQRRVIAAAEVPIANRREKAREHQGFKNDLAGAVASLRKRFPTLEVKVSDDGTSASFHRYANEGLCNHISGRVYASADGGFSASIDRLGSLSGDTFTALYALLFNGGEG